MRLMLGNVQSFDEVSSLLRSEAKLWQEDRVVPLNKIYATPEGTVTSLQTGPLTITPWAKKQLSTLLGIRWERWFDKVSGAELAEEINRRLYRSEESIKLRIRAPRPGEASSGDEAVLAALVSKSYTPIEDMRVWNNLNQVLSANARKAVGVIPPQFTDRSTHLCVLGENPVEVKIGNETETYYAGFYLRNSQVGFTALTIDIYFLRLVCVNGLMVSTNEFQLLYRTHRPIVEKALNTLLHQSLSGLEGRWEQGLSLLGSAGQKKLINPEVVLKNYLRQVPGMRHLNKPIIEELNRSSDSSAFNLIQAMTHVAKGLPQPDQRYELERLAGELLLAKETEV